MSNDRQRHALVSGSSSGIGRAIVEALLAGGWRVTGLDLAPASFQHPAFRSLELDLGDGDAIAQAVPVQDPVDALVHAAGVLRVAPLGQLDHNAGDLMWRLHVQAAARLCDLLVPAMAAAGQGRVVLVGSRVSQGMPGRSQYAATKAALVALARSWAAEVVGQGVTVNVISPAATATAMVRDPARVTSAPRVPPLGRYIEPTEIAALVQYLLSPVAGAITGQDIAICGGASLPR